MRRRLWLTAASLIYVGWRRVRTFGRAGDSGHNRNVAA
jgi:hypothetical protein